jgi:FAD/FMN-containing dehydrogenase
MLRRISTQLIVFTEREAAPSFCEITATFFFFWLLPQRIIMNAESALKEALSHLVLERTSAEYNEANESYFTLFASALKPAIIAQPGNANEVSDILRAVTPHWKENVIRIAVRGTGHTPFAGSANIADGITIDLRKMKGININDRSSTVCIGVGETWGSVYDALENHGLTTAGGRVGRVGVGGLVLGGEKRSGNI